MALLKSAQQTSCPHCQAANPSGSPYCVRCGAPLGDISGPSALAAGQASQTSSRFSTPVLQAETPHFHDSFLSEGQDPILARSTFERAAGIMIAGESIEYVATANRAVGHMPDCVVATNKRIMLYKKRTFGKLELDDMFWRDLEGVQMKEGRNGVLLIFDSIQGWQIIAESLPKSQAWRLHEFAQKYGERLSGKVQERQVAQQPQAVAVPQAPKVTQPQVAAAPAEAVQPSPAPSPAVASAPRQYIYTAQAAAPAVQPAQAAAFHAQPPAQSEVVVFDTQTTHPVLHEPASPAAPAPARSAAPVSAQPTQPRPASGPLAAPQQPPSPAKPSGPLGAAPRPAAPAATAGQSPAPVKATSPLAPSPAPMQAHPQGQNSAQPKMGSGPLSSRLAQTPAPAPAPQRAYTTSPISDTPSPQDDPVRKMKQLKDMLDADLITQEDYEAKKAEILSRL